MTAQTLAIVVLLVSFFVMIFLRFPIAYAVGLSFPSLGVIAMK